MDLDPEMTPPRYEAKRRLEQAYYRSRNARVEWLRALRDMHTAGFTPAEIARMVGVTAEEIAADLGGEMRNPD